jgi:protein-disulfide isomerase
VWGVQKDPTEALKKIAALGGIGADQFNKCINDEDLSKKIVAGEYEAEQKFGVNSTPTFFINGKKLVGALPYDDFVKEMQKAQAALPAKSQTAQSGQ